MSATYYTLKEFFIHIHDEISIEEAEEYVSWTKYDEVAPLCPQETLFYGTPTKEILNSSQKFAKNFHTTPSHQADKWRPSVRFDLTSKAPHGQTTPNIQMPQSSTSPPISSSLELQFKRLVIPLGTIPDEELNLEQKRRARRTTGDKLDANNIDMHEQQLAEILPLDISIIDIESDKVFVPTLNGEDSDSVSYIQSSDDDEDGYING